MDTTQVTALPPGISGAARGELVLELGVLTWSRSANAKNAPKKAHLLVRWWGDPGPGYPMRLIEGEAAHFPVCCAPKYFGRYLKDMGNLQLTLYGSGQVLGQTSIDVRFLDASAPIKGAFPVISLTGQHVASLEVSLHVFFDTPANEPPVEKPGQSISQAQAHIDDQAMLHGVVGSASQQPPQPPQAVANQSTNPATSDVANLQTSTAEAELLGPPHTQLILLPPTTQQHGVTAPPNSSQHALPAPTPQLFEMLHASLSRDVEKCFTVFSSWEAEDSSTRSLTGLLDLLHQHQVLELPLSPHQVYYVVTVMDPAHELALDMEAVLLALRQCLEAELRVSSAQLGPILPQLVHIIQGIQQRSLSLKAALHAPAALGGQQGHMTVDDFVSWLQKELPRIDRQLLRYVVLLLLNVCDGPTGSVTYQDVLALEQLVLGQGAAPAPDMLGRDSQERRAALQDHNNTALARLKRRRAVRPAQSSGGGAPPVEPRVAVAGQQAQSSSDGKAEDTHSSLRKNQASPPTEKGRGNDAQTTVRSQLPMAPPDNNTVYANSHRQTVQGQHETSDHDDMDQPGTNDKQDQRRIGSVDDIQRILQEAGDLQQQLAHAMDEGSQSLDISPSHRRVRGTKLTTDALAALGSTAPPEVLLDILCDPDNDSHSSHSIPGYESSPHSFHHTHSFMAGGRDQAAARQQLGSAGHMYTAPGSGFSSPHAHRPPRAYKQAAARSSPAGYHSDNDSVDTDEEGAAAFVEQQLMQHLFYNAISPGTKRQAVEGADGGATSVGVDEEDNTSEASLPSQSKFEHMTQPAVSKHEPNQPGLLVQISDLRLPQQPPVDSVGEFVLSARTTFTHTQQRSVISTDAQQSQAQLMLGLSASSSIDPLTAPPALLIIEVWQSPSSSELQTMQMATHQDPLIEEVTAPRPAKLVGIVSIPLSAASQNLTREKTKDASAAAMPEVAESALASDNTALAAEGVFNVIDVLNDDVLGSVHVTAKLVGCIALLRYTWHVTVCSAEGLPDADAMSAAGLPAPTSRHIKYWYPGEASALVTDDVPATPSPIFAATAMHTVVLPAGTLPTQQLLLGVGGAQLPELEQQQQDAQLAFEVWDRWEAGPDSCVAAATLPLSVLLQAHPGVDVAQELPLQLKTTALEATLMQQQQEGGHIASDDHSPPNTQAMVPPGQHMVPTLEVRLRTESVMVGAYPTPDKESGVEPTTPDESHPHYTADHEGDANNQPLTSNQSPRPQHNEGDDKLVSTDRTETRPGGLLPVASLPAVMRVDIIAACGLQAAVQEAAAWLGGGSALLGRAHQLGPHPFVVLNLFPADQRLSACVPALRTPFQAQSFCPRYDWHAEVELQLDSHSLAALLTQQLCVEVWHHPSRSLAALAGRTGDGQAAVKISSTGASAGPKEVLLGSGGCALDKLLLHPQGVQSWVLLRSARGQAVGAVQLSLRFITIAGQQVDTCLAAPPPLAQYPDLATMLPTDIPMPELDARSFSGQWCRATLFIEQAVVMQPMTSVPRAGSKSVQYYATYTMPGSDIEVMTAAKKPSSNDKGSSSVTGLSSKTANNVSSTHIPLQHVAVHWVKGDARLAGALARCPLKLKLWRIHERLAGGAGSSSQGLGLQQGSAAVSSAATAQLVGSVDIDASHLVMRPPASKPLPARWVSGTFHVVDPAAICYTPAQVRVKLLLELSPPSTPSSAVLASHTWQPGEEYSATPTRSTVSEVAFVPASPGDVPAAVAEHEPLPSKLLQSGEPQEQASVVGGLQPAQQKQPQQDMIGAGPTAILEGISHDDSPLPVAASTGLPANNQNMHRLPRQLPQADMFSITRHTPTAAAAQHKPHTAQAGPSHPVLGVTSPARATTAVNIAAAATNTPSPTYQQTPEQQHLQESIEDTEHQAVPLQELFDMSMTTDNMSTMEDPAVRLRQQLQELDVLGLQWQRRLGAQHHIEDVVLERNAITDGGHIAGGGAVVTATATDSYTQLYNPSSSQQLTYTSAGNQAHSPALHEPYMGGAAPSSQHTAEANEHHDDDVAQADGPGVWVATVRSLPPPNTSTPGQGPAVPIHHHIEVCSDDGGIDTVLGGYSASEADTDELLAGITVMHATHDGDADSNFGSPQVPSSPTRNSYEVSTAHEAVVSHASMQQPAGSTTQSAVTQAPVATATHDDWLYTFSRPARALNNSHQVMHPCMMPPGLLAATHTSTAVQHPSHGVPESVQARHGAGVQSQHPAMSTSQHEQDPSLGMARHNASDVTNGLGITSSHQASRPQLGALQARLDALLFNFQADLRHTGTATDAMPTARLSRYDSSDDDDLLIHQPGITTIHTSVSADDTQAAGAESGPHFANALPPLQPDFHLQYSG